MRDFSLLEENSQIIPQKWFDAQVGRDHTHSALKAFKREEVAALQDWYDGKSTLEEAAQAITQPIVDSPIPELGTYSDEITALCHLWQLLIDALIEWPSARTPQLFSLLAAISKVSGGIHHGKASDDDEKPLSWAGLPYLILVWFNCEWMNPGQIAKRTTEDAARANARRVYIKQQDIEAQLVAADMLAWKYAIKYLIHALEKTPDPTEETDTTYHRHGNGPVKLDFHIPAVACWIKHNGQRVYDSLLRDEVKDWNKKDIPTVAMQFEHPAQRWLYWEKRLQEVAENGPDEDTRAAAKLTAKEMRDIARD